jgi:hypothetical protein
MLGRSDWVNSSPKSIRARAEAEFGVSVLQDVELDKNDEKNKEPNKKEKERQRERNVLKLVHF